MYSSYLCVQSCTLFSVDSIVDCLYGFISITNITYNENSTAGGRGDEGGDEQVEGVEEPVATRVPLTIVPFEEQLRLVFALQRPIPESGFGLYALLNIVYSVKLLLYL